MFIPLTPLRCLHRAVDLFGSKTGVVSGDRHFTYAQFGERVERLADGLTRLGIEAGDRVAYLSFNNHQLLEGYYGVVQARAIVMPLNVRLAESELAAILAHSGAKMVIFETDFAPVAERLRMNLPGVQRWVSIGPASGEKVDPAELTYEEIIDQGRARRADIFSYDEMSIAELFYTSGSTGTPKGVMLAHRTLYLHALAVALQCGRAESMVDLHTIPLFHANGWGRPQASTLLGNKQVMVRRFEPAAVFKLIEEHRATDMSLVHHGQLLAECVGPTSFPREVGSFQHAAHDDRRRGEFSGIGGTVGKDVPRMPVRGGLRLDGDIARDHHRILERRAICVRPGAMAATGHDRLGRAGRGRARGRPGDARRTSRWQHHRRNRDPGRYGDGGIF